MNTSRIEKFLEVSGLRKQFQFMATIVANSLLPQWVQEGYITRGIGVVERALKIFPEMLEKESWIPHVRATMSDEELESAIKFFESSSGAKVVQLFTTPRDGGEQAMEVLKRAVERVEKEYPHD